MRGQLPPQGLCPAVPSAWNVLPPDGDRVTFKPSPSLHSYQLPRETSAALPAETVARASLRACSLYIARTFQYAMEFICHYSHYL